jgi:hypothetical protein
MPAAPVTHDRRRANALTDQDDVMTLAFGPSPPLTPDIPGEIPFALTPLGETDLATAMADYLRAARPGSGAEALRTLRRAFPDSPLTLRVAALAALMRR